jgi:putative nucleotidyltransferase with HDIG domain
MPTAAQLLQEFTDTKTLPHVALRLSKLLSQEGSRIQEFDALIKMDPVLVTRLLRMVNSPYYGLSEKITSISRAIVFIGMKNLRNLVVLDGLKDLIPEDTQNGVFSRKQLWLHCVAVSVCSQMIAERIFGQRGEDAFLCGILHDVGMIVEDQTAPDLFMKTCTAVGETAKGLPQVEKEMIGTDHCEIGALLAKEWKMPEEIKEGIRRHHGVDESVAPSTMTGILQLAEFMAGKLGHPALKGIQGKVSASLAEHVRENLPEYQLLAKEIPSRMAMARSLYERQEV